MMATVKRPGRIMGTTDVAIAGFDDIPAATRPGASPRQRMAWLPDGGERGHQELTPLLAKSWGLGARVQGRRRYYAVIFDATTGEGGASIRLVRRRDAETTLATGAFAWKVDHAYAVGLRLATLRASDDSAEALSDGGIALLVDTGSLATQAVAVRPAS
jgi:hypothetical protein